MGRPARRHRHPALSRVLRSAPHPPQNRRHTFGMAHQVRAGRFVGRTEELARLRELLARAADGQPQVAASASRRGVRVLDGGCVPLGEEGLPFAPVVEALRDLDAAELEAVAGPARAELGRLLPDLAWGSEAVAAGAVAGAGQGRLFELLLGLVQRLA